VGHLANASDTVAAKVDSLSLILPHLVVANLSYGLGWLAPIAFPLSFTLGQISIHFRASFETKIAEFLIDGGRADLLRLVQVPADYLPPAPWTFMPLGHFLLYLG